MLTPDARAHFWKPRRGRASGPEAVSRSVSRFVRFGKGPVLLRNQGVARVVLVVIGRGVSTTNPHDAVREGLKLNLTPRGPLGGASCSAAMLVPPALPWFSGA